MVSGEGNELPTSHMSFYEQGCVKCRQGVLTGKWPPPTEIAVSEGPIFLHRCEFCGSYWGINWREGHVISEVEARQKFPNAFKQS